jgi:hypothetical protein
MHGATSQKTVNLTLHFDDIQPLKPNNQETRRILFLKGHYTLNFHHWDQNTNPRYKQFMPVQSVCCQNQFLLGLRLLVRNTEHNSMASSHGRSVSRLLNDTGDITWRRIGQEHNKVNYREMKTVIPYGDTRCGTSENMVCVHFGIGTGLEKSNS